MTHESHPSRVEHGLVLPDVPGLRTHPDGLDPDRLAGIIPAAVARIVQQGNAVWAETAEGPVTGRFDLATRDAVTLAGDLARHHVTRALILALTAGRAVVLDGCLAEADAVPRYSRDPRARIAELLAHANASLEQRRALRARLREMEQGIDALLADPELPEAARTKLVRLREGSS